MFLSKLKLERKQKLKKIQKSGRNNLGRITVRHKGKGHKKALRTINWTKSYNSSILIGTFYNPNQNNMLYQFVNSHSLETFFQPAVSGVSFLNSFTENNSNYSLSRFLLSDFSIGEKCNNLGSKKISDKNQSIYSRAGGSYSTILQRYTWVKNYMLVELSSGEQKLFLNSEKAQKGAVLGHTSAYDTIKTAGRNRWLGKRPTVRGVAMNPIDHPHGGGEGKTSGGRPSVSPWGRLTKNVKTKKNKRSLWKIFHSRHNTK